MRKLFFILIITNLFISCSIKKVQKEPVFKDISGRYKQQNSSLKLDLNTDNTYKLWNHEQTQCIIEQCEYTSIGKWSVLADNLIEITSENYYKKQKGYKYELKKENKFSQDSLYIKVVFPYDLPPVKLNFYFNNYVSKSITTDETYIVIPKSKYLFKKSSNNFIAFNLDADIAGTTIYKSRILFDIFSEYFDTNKYNFLTINLPYFDVCFFEFELYNQDYIYIKNKKTLIWNGNVWEKIGKD
ncbi:hypothetical protein [Aureivirga sp. CE67]|uniref:hypothetical protein n=1 Tax=Aureivirga sp. CE67 TaxID=1788983 RepID=UPI0018CADF1A|nr:hypothetical protein [Aureivirga sp. CE67]